MSIGYSIGQPVKAPGNFDVDGELAVKTDKFVADASGNVEANGYLDIEDYLDVSSDAFLVSGGDGTASVGDGKVTMDATTGDTQIAGHLHVGGRAYLNAPDSAPGSLANGRISFYLDEANHKLKVSVRYSGGTSKTGESSLA